MTQKQKEVFELLSNSLYYETENGEELSKDLIKKLCNSISDMVNSFSFKPEKLTEAILKDTLSRATFKQIALLWVDRLSNAKYFDGRNEYSVETSKKIANLDNIKESIIFYKKMLLDEEFNLSNCLSVDHIFKTAVRIKCPVPVIVVEFMAREHRTLQQTFSSLVFYFLLNAGGKEEEDLKQFEKENHRFFVTPLI